MDSDLKLLREFASSAGSSLEETQNNLQTVTEELAQLYHHVCTVNGQTPTRVVLDHEKEGMTPSEFLHFKTTPYNLNQVESMFLYKKIFLVAEQAPSIGEISKLEHLRNHLKCDIPLHDLESLNDTATLARNVCTVVDQIKHLKNAIENTIELSKTKRENSNGSYEGKISLFLLRNSIYI